MGNNSEKLTGYFIRLGIKKKKSDRLLSLQRTLITIFVGWLNLTKQNFSFACYLRIHQGGMCDINLKLTRSRTRRSTKRNARRCSNGILNRKIIQIFSKHSYMRLSRRFTRFSFHSDMFFGKKKEIMRYEDRMWGTEFEISQVFFSYPRNSHLFLHAKCVTMYLMTRAISAMI